MCCRCVQGTVEVGIFTEPGAAVTATIGPGDLGFAPTATGHYVRNVGNTTAHLALIFDTPRIATVDVSNFLGAMPPSWVATSLGVDTAAARAFDFSRVGVPGAL
jgi:oxalate decarboxylase/phosphoglucose isomerase-like protein (cupin superfamily)